MFIDMCSMTHLIGAITAKGTNGIMDIRSIAVIGQLPKVFVESLSAVVLSQSTIL